MGAVKIICFGGRSGRIDCAKIYGGRGDGESLSDCFKLKLKIRYNPSRCYPPSIPEPPSSSTTSQHHSTLQPTEGAKSTILDNPSGLRVQGRVGLEMSLWESLSDDIGHLIIERLSSILDLVLSVSYIHLPVMDARLHQCLHPQFEISRLIVSPNSTQDDYMVVAIYDDQNEIATVKSGEESWFLIKPAHQDRDRGTGYSDIIFHKGLVYAVTVKHKIVAFDVGVRPPKVKILLPQIERPAKLNNLVQSTNMELLLVERHRGRETDGVAEHNEEEEEYDGGEVVQYDAEEYLEDYEGSSDDEEDGDWEEGDGEEEGYDGEENEEVDSEEEGDGEENEKVDGDEGEVEGHKRVPGSRFNYQVKVYRLMTNELSGKIMKKIELSSLNGDALFLGDNMSVSFSAAPC
uniref:KIB1-4 beta-propeller domain-containing protein n=1 Tax=Kalanchoe fedtschenkoi TaxID=63787 RepID=A0A7N0TEH8_KALFE